MCEAGPSNIARMTPPPSRSRSRSPNAQQDRDDASIVRSATGSDRSRRLTRRAMMGSAVEGLQRFKQSWLSIMILKGGIGLGQVIALLTLLILAATLDSPLFPGAKQTAPSDACRHPELFQIWMAVNLFRLTLCWSVSCWMCVRYERARRRRASVERAIEQGEAAVGVHERQASMREMATTLSSAPGSIRPTRPPGVRMNTSETVSTVNRLPPSLSHSASSGSSATLPHFSSSASTPATIYSTAIGSAPELSRIPEKLAKEQHQQVQAHPYEVEAQIELGSPQAPEHVQTPIPAASGADRVAPSDSNSDPDSVRQRRLRTQRSLQQARELAQGRSVRVEEDEDEAERATGFAAWLDRHALNISRSLGIVSTVLFILGNILLFYPPPTSHSCYAAAPMLWWGVMTVTGVGWVLFAQVFFVVIIVGLGGHVVLNSLRKIGLLPTPPPAEVPRAPRPEPLQPEELNKLKVVCYVAEPVDPNSAVAKRSSASIPTTPTGVTSDPVSASAARPVDYTRLPYPPIHLDSHHTTCAICQETFTPPQEGRTIMLKAEPLRLLGCGHVFHTECIDQWLLKGSGNCPSCNRCVRETWKRDKEDKAAQSSVSPSRRRAPHS